MQSKPLTNKEYWQNYKPGEIPAVPNLPPIELYDTGRSLKVLDIGTGDGKAAEELSQTGSNRVYGIDIAENIIATNLERETRVEYSLQDITQATNFESSFFDLALSRFLLTNIPADGRGSAVAEIFRVLAPNGKLWILEPLVSDSYKERYQLAQEFSQDPNSVVVFKQKDLAEKILTKSEMAKAFKANLFSRIVKHYTFEEIIEMLKPLTLVDSRIIEIKSPSGYTINTLEAVFQKQN